ncbi:PIG-L family deacetylase [Lagierella sp.]|uniref:PIG-L family deacetylase n=1 Tax=Lagierella sp. TaxID=2849657 RepID=UPI002637C9AF|nr:PIG-L family deacetylase [Lagierella sp.]
MWKDNLAKLLYYPIKWYNLINIKKIYRAKKLKGKTRKLQVPLGDTLVISPHVDDESIGLGGLLLNNYDFNKKVDLIYLTDSSGSKSKGKEDIKSIREREARSLVKKLNLRSLKIFSAKNNHVDRYTKETCEELRGFLQGRTYEKIFIVSPFDSHYEHRWTNYIFSNVAKTLNISSRIYLYEVSNFLPDNLINCHSVFNGREKEGLFKIFESQTVAMDFDIFLQLNKYKSISIGENGFVEYFSELDISDYIILVDEIDDKKIQEKLPRRIANHRTFYKVLRDNK